MKKLGGLRLLRDSVLKSLSCMMLLWICAAFAADAGADPQRLKQIEALGSKDDASARLELLALVQNKEASAGEREAAVKALVRTKSGGLALLKLADDEKLDEALKSTACLACANCADEEVRKQGEKALPPPRSKDNQLLANIEKLAAMTGDAQAGKIIFHDAKGANCISCHQIGDEGRFVGPPLTTIGEKLNKPQLYESILTPSAGILMGFENWIVKLKSGMVVNGILAEDTDDHITLKDAEAEYHDYPAAEVEKRTRQNISIMPEGLAAKMTLKELVDLVEYLARLKN